LHGVNSDTDQLENDPQIRYVQHQVQV